MPVAEARFCFDPAMSETALLALAGTAIANALGEHGRDRSRWQRGPEVRLLHNPGARRAWSLAIRDDTGRVVESSTAGLDEAQLLAWGYARLVERAQRNPWRAQVVLGLLPRAGAGAEAPAGAAGGGAR